MITSHRHRMFGARYIISGSTYKSSGGEGRIERNSGL